MTMSRDYNLDPKAASEASNHNRRITTSGSYVGSFKAAWFEKNEKGTESVCLLFDSKAGQSCALRLYTHNFKGEPLVSFGTLNAIMTCMKVKTMKATPGDVTAYDFDQRADVTMRKETYPEIVDKPIGLLIQMEEYTGRNGVKHRPQIVGAFDPATSLVAKEILDRQTEPRALEGMQRWLTDNPVRHERKPGKPVGTPAIDAHSSDDFGDDDIPF